MNKFKLNPVTGQLDLVGIETPLTSDLDVNNYILNNVDVIELNTLHTPNGEVIGSIYWNSDEETVDAKVSDTVTLQVGQEMLFSAINQTGADIPDGTFVMFAGTLGNSGKFLIQKGIADGSLPPEYTMGLTTESILNGEEGKVTWFGKVRGIDTTGTPYGEIWNDGDILYASQTTAGALTNVKPTSGLVIIVAAVVHAQINGTLFIRPTWHDKINQLITKTSDYTITGLEADGEIILLIDASSNDVDITLPAASVMTGRFINLKRIDNTNNVVTIVGTLDGKVNQMIQYQNTNAKITSDGTNYYII